MNIQLAEGEIILKEGMANHYKGMVNVGGKLYLTNLRLFFKSHAANLRGDEASYRLADITAARPRNALGIVPNGITITLTDGREEKFEVSGRQAWLEKILNALQNQNSGLSV